MSDNKKYYYLKFKENYFEQDHIKVIENIKPNGHTYSLILIKLYLKSLKWDGQLRVNEAIPYYSDKIDMLSGVLNHDPDHVMHAIDIAKDMGVIEIVDSGEIFMRDIHSFIGQDSTEAERKRVYRLKIKNRKQIGQGVDERPDTSDDRPPELELDIKKELNTDIENIPINKKPTLDEIKTYCDTNCIQVDYEHFYYHYAALNWVVNGNPIIDWQSKLREWRLRGNKYPNKKTGGSAAKSQEDLVKDIMNFNVKED